MVATSSSGHPTMPRPNPHESGAPLGLIKATPNRAAVKRAGLDNASTRLPGTSAVRDGERPVSIEQGNVVGGYVMTD